MQSNEVDLIFEQSRSISHEIRNHLSICELYSEIIKKHLEKDNIQNQSINNAIKCIQKSLKIIGNSLLDLKSLNNIKSNKHDLKTILTTGVDMASVYMLDKNIKITCNIKTSAIVFIDENKFLACIVNIIKNAIEAIEKKGDISVSLSISEGFAYIKISNNGTSISKEKQKQIFEEGFSTKPTGSGLGLHICSNNLKAQNAELRLNKSNDKITEFEIIIPVI